MDIDFERNYLGAWHLKHNARYKIQCKDNAHYNSGWYDIKVSTDTPSPHGWIYTVELYDTYEAALNEMAVLKEEKPYSENFLRVMWENYPEDWDPYSYDGPHDDTIDAMLT